MVNSKILGPFFAFAILIFANAEQAENSTETPLLLVLSFDGLRADFLNEILTPNLWKLAREGVWAPYGVKPQVVTVTAPNYYSIVTGLYEENHGIIGNTFYDADLKEKYDYWKVDDPEIVKRARDPKWYKGDPIWQLNEKAGRNSGALHWPLCDAEINNMRMSRCVPWEDYGDLPTWTNDLEQLFTWYLDKKNPVNLGFMYISEPDHTEHKNDIYSTRVKTKLAELDLFVWNLIRKLKSLDLYDRMNIIFVSDHGHSNVQSGQQNYINLDSILEPGEYIWSSYSIFPSPNVRAEDLYYKLKQAHMRSPRFEVYWKHEAPERYHYKNNPRIGPIILLPRLGYSFDSPESSIYSTHGYSADYFEMRAAFFAVGPAFNRNLTIDWDIENIDLYSLMAAVLRLEPAQNDGNFTRVLPLLRKSWLDLEKAPVLVENGADKKSMPFISVYFLIAFFAKGIF